MWKNAMGEVCPKGGIEMINCNFISVNKSSITTNGSGKTHFKFNVSPYQTVSWSDNQTFFFNIKLLLSDTKLYKKMLSSNEKREYKRLFKSLYNLNKTPDENKVKECIIVFTNGVTAIGLKSIDGDVYTGFKSTRLNEIKAICKKNRVKTEFDNKIAFDLFSDSYLDEIPPHYLLTKIAERFIKIFKKDIIFKLKVSEYFLSVFNDTVKKV